MENVNRKPEDQGGEFVNKLREALKKRAKAEIKFRKVTGPMLRDHYIREGKKIAREWQQE